MGKPAAAATEEAPLNPDPDKGQLFNLPRPRITLLDDQADPDKVVVSFGGQVELSRKDPRHIEFLNRLKPGAEVDLALVGRSMSVAPKVTLDKEGYVKEKRIVASVRVTDVVIDGERAGAPVDDPDGED